MKKVLKSKEYEPTIGDVLTAVQEGFTQHERILNRHDKLLGALREGQDTFREQMNDFGRRLTNTQNRVEDIADNLENVTRLNNKDRVTVIDHERRIKRLETARG